MAANHGPVDQTLGHKFKLPIYMRRWKTEESINVTRSATGWLIGYVSDEEACDKRGAPHLPKLLGDECVNYPAAFGYYMEFLWNQAELGLSHEQVQHELRQLGTWVSACEKATPSGFFDPC